jgi:hypothetical protein
LTNISSYLNKRKNFCKICSSENYCKHDSHSHLRMYSKIRDKEPNKMIAYKILNLKVKDKIIIGLFAIIQVYGTYFLQGF